MGSVSEMGRMYGDRMVRLIYDAGYLIRAGGYMYCFY